MSLGVQPVTSLTTALFHDTYELMIVCSWGLFLSQYESDKEAFKANKSWIFDVKQAEKIHNFKGKILFTPFLLQVAFEENYTQTTYWNNFP